MKKAILATVVLVVLSLSSFAGGKNEDRKLLSDLQAALKSSTQVQWVSKADYNRATFMFNGKVVAACYDQYDDHLIGFSIHFAQTDLPKEVAEAISKKYSDWSVVDAILFIDSDAYVNYFVQVQKGKSNLALKIINGKASIYSKMFL